MVTVREQDAGRVDYGAGYGSAEGVSAFLEIGHSNIMGVGRSLSLRLETEGPNRSYSLNFREPWIYDSPYDLRLSLISQRVKREAYTLDATALQASLDHEFSPTTRGSLLYTLEENRLSNVDKSVVLTSKDDSPYLLSSIGPLLVWDSRDDPFNPRKGYYHSFQVEWALTAIGSQVDYTKYLGMMSGYFSLDRFTLALLARGGLADFIGKEMVLPLNKRFFLGGRSSVRGFARDQVGPKSDDGTPMGGDVMANLKAELRFPVYKDFGMALFWDAGQVWIRDQEKVSWGTLRHAAGGGLRYNTPVGPISLDVGWKLDRKEGETPYEWYFTIGNVF
jgi:outer membrane protein insertion porin family